MTQSHQAHPTDKKADGADGSLETVTGSAVWDKARAAADVNLEDDPLEAALRLALPSWAYFSTENPHGHVDQVGEALARRLGAHILHVDRETGEACQHGPTTHVKVTYSIGVWAIRFQRTDTAAGLYWLQVESDMANNADTRLARENLTVPEVMRLLNEVGALPGNQAASAG